MSRERFLEAPRDTDVPRISQGFCTLPHVVLCQSRLSWPFYRLILSTHGHHREPLPTFPSVELRMDVLAGRFSISLVYVVELTTSASFLLFKNHIGSSLGRHSSIGNSVHSDLSCHSRRDSFQISGCRDCLPYGHCRHHKVDNLHGETVHLRESRSGYEENRVVWCN